jgi:hypothetical protein
MGAIRSTWLSVRSVSQRRLAGGFIFGIGRPLASLVRRLVNHTKAALKILFKRTLIECHREHWQQRHPQNGHTAARPWATRFVFRTQTAKVVLIVACHALA